MEVIRRYPTLLPTTSFIASDISSSPGGWTYHLALLSNCEHVYAIDPGDMKPSKRWLESGKENVTWFKEKVKDCFERLEEVNLLTCDMNACLRVTVDSCLPIFRGMEGVRGVVTLKNFVGGEKKMDEAVLIQVKR